MNESNSPDILVVEDDESLSSFLRELLEEEGLTVRRAGNGREALAEIDRHAPDLILTDIVMPDCDGVELIMALRQRRDGIPIIAMSGGRRTSDLYLDTASRLGAATVLHKPFPSSELLAAIANLLPSPGPG